MRIQSNLSRQLLTFLGVGWLALIFYLYFIHGFLISALLIALASASLYLLYIEYDVRPRQRLEEINDLTEIIIEQTKENPQPIQLDERMTEVKPIVEALTLLLKYQEDRFLQERDFTADASHELRTPLAGIRLQAQIAMMTTDEIKKTQALEKVLKAVDRGTRLVEQLLVLSRLTMDKVELEMGPLDMRLVCSNIVDQWRMQAQEKNINIQLISGVGQANAHASESSIEIMLDNLLRNALRFTPEEGSIILNVEEDNDYIELDIMDTGPGIPLEDHQKVFNRFQKASNGSKAGTGLGLAIVRRIVDLHHGEVKLDFAHEHHGLKVCVSIPKEPEVASRSLVDDFAEAFPKLTEESVEHKG